MLYETYGFSIIRSIIHMIKDPTLVLGLESMKGKCLELKNHFQEEFNFHESHKITGRVPA